MNAMILAAALLCPADPGLDAKAALALAAAVAPAAGDCRRCGGYGRVFNPDPTGDPRVKVICPECLGSGKRSARDDKSLGCPCGIPDCPCGCREGKPCTCACGEMGKDGWFFCKEKRRWRQWLWVLPDGSKVPCQPGETCHPAQAAQTTQALPPLTYHPTPALLGPMGPMRPMSPMFFGGGFRGGFAGGAAGAGRG
jgi:hypothetical protein